MVGLKQKENCETKRDKRPPSYIGGAKMAKIFATKALSMVLCFVMLFMGAPVTSWAFDLSSSSITVTKGGEEVYDSDIMLDTEGGTLMLTANGFTGDNVTWSLSPYAGTWVSFGKDDDSNPIVFTEGKSVILQLDTLPAFDTTVKVTACSADTTSQEAYVSVTLKKPDGWTIDRVEEASSCDISFMSGFGIILADGPGFAVLEVSDATGPVPMGSFVSANNTVMGNAEVDDSGRASLAVIGVGSTAVTVTLPDDVTVAFHVSVDSTIQSVSLYDAANAKLGAGKATASVNDTITAKVFGAGGETDEIEGAGVEWFVTDDNGGLVEASDNTYSFVGSELTFNTAGTYNVKATSTFDRSKSSPEVMFTVTAADPVVDSVKIYDDEEKTNEISELEMQIGGEPVTLYATAFAGETADETATITWDLTDGDDVVILEGSVITLLPEAAEGDTATITAKFSETVKAQVEVTVTAAAKRDAELQAHLNNTFNAPLSGSVMLDSSGNGVLYVRAVDKDTSTPVTGATLTASITSGTGTGTAVLDQATGCVTISDASDRAVLTISSTTPEGYNTIQPLTIMLTRAAAPPVQVYGVNVWRTDDLKMTTVSSLTLGVDGTVGLTADVISNSTSDKGVEWSSDKPSVVSVSGTGYDATLTAKAVGNATITVTSEDNEDVTHKIEVTVKEAVNLSFTPRAAVYNKDLWGDTFAAEPQARFARMIGTVPTGTDLTQFDKISIKKSSGELIVNNAFATLYLTDGATTVSTWATSLRDAGLLASNKLPVCFMFDAMDAFEQGDYTITLTSFAGDTFTTWINVTQNDVEKNATWTAGSSSDLKIASIPTITNDLLVKLVSDLTLSQDGTKLLSGKGVTDILKADSTGNVYIKKEILDTLDAGTYSISFKAGDRSESFNFIVVDHRAAWGDPMTRLADRKVQYVDAAGKASIELTSENLANGILWLLEDSGGTSAWYGIDLSTGAFELDKGSRFYVQWLHQDDAEYDTYYAQLDDEQKSQIENGWIFLIGVEDASGNKVQPESPVKTYVQIGDDWDLDELKAYYIAAGDDQSVDVEDILGFSYPEGEDEFGMMMLSHFSPYLIMDELSDAEKIALGKGNNNKTGDQAVQVAVAGFGSILVLALGIMLRLITSKKKFEE